MYQYTWDTETHGFLLMPTAGEPLLPLRPVYHEELDMLGFNKYWQYPHVEAPLLWADGARRYHVDGRLVAELKGGGFYTDPSLDVKEHNLVLQPVDIKEMVARNSSIAAGLEQTAIAMIFDMWKKYKKKDALYVAFSGGKDSVVLLDLVYRSLGVKDFTVVFGDTGMELPDTHESVADAIARYSDLDIYSAESVLKPEQSWTIFGPPARRQRWCCSVHKSAPSILKLREIHEKPILSLLVFDGVRAEESNTRADYAEETNRAKHAAQVNVRPLLNWNSAEIFNYIYAHGLFLNRVYRKGFTRAGCAICPMSFGWRDFMTRKWYADLVEPFMREIESYAVSAVKDRDDVRGYIEEGGWMARVGGKHIPQARSLVSETLQDGVLGQEIECNKALFLEWAKVLPGFRINSPDSATVAFNSGVKYDISLQEKESGLVVSYSPVINQYSERTELKYLRMLANKAAYCVGCQVCEAECIHGALKISPGKVQVDEGLCQHCMNCFTFDKGCLVAKSLYISKEGRSLKSYDRYATFGMEMKFVEKVFAGKISDLGKKQQPAIKAWMREACMMTGDDLTPFGKQVEKWGLADTKSWALIWVNLAYNSSIVNWFVSEIATEISYSKNELLDQLKDGGKERTRENALAALINTLKNPLISDELGQANMQQVKRQTMLRKGAWRSPDPLVVLYALYRYAEEEGGRHSFTLSQLCSEVSEHGISPTRLFGLSKDSMESLLRGLAINQPSFISVELALGLDNINLSVQKTSDDIWVQLM